MSLQQTSLFCKLHANKHAAVCLSLQTKEFYTHFLRISSFDQSKYVVMMARPYDAIEIWLNKRSTL